MEAKKDTPFSNMLAKLKTGAIMETMDLTTYGGWANKKRNLANWSVSDIHKVAKLLHRTPMEVFNAIYLEAQGEMVDEIPK